MPKRYFAMPHFMFQPSPDFDNRAPFDAMSKAAIQALGLLLNQYNGRNNGDLSAAPKVCEAYGIGRTTARRGIVELAFCGLIVETKRGGLNQTGLFGLAWLGLDEEVSHKFDDGIEASSIPLQTWTMQHRTKRTKHLVDEHQRTREKRKGGRWATAGKKNPLHTHGGKEKADLHTHGGKAPIGLAHP